MAAIAVAVLLGLFLPGLCLDSGRAAISSVRSNHVAADGDVGSEGTSVVIDADGSASLPVRREYVAVDAISSVIINAAGSASLLDGDDDDDDDDVDDPDDDSNSSSFEQMTLLRHSEKRFGNSTDVEEDFKIVWTKLENWGMIGGAVVVFLVMDRYVLEKISHTSVGHLGLVVFWIVVAMLYNLVVFVKDGEDSGFQWSLGYMMEWFLSIDNLFVFHLIFKHFKVPEELRHIALYFGISGAIAFRFVFFYGFGSVMAMMLWSKRVFGCFLIISGFMALRADGDDDEFNPQDSYMVRALRWCLGDRLKESYNTEGRSFFFYDSDKIRASLLLVVVLVLECTDIVFAIDSVSAKIVQIPDIYISLSSSIFAMFGLRATFYIVDDIINAFELLKYGVCIILLFIGLELVLSPLIDIPPAAVCLMFASVFAICIVGSLVIQRRKRLQADTAAAALESEAEKLDKNPQDDFRSDEEPLLEAEGKPEDPSSSSTQPPSAA